MSRVSHLLMLAVHRFDTYFGQLEQSVRGGSPLVPPIPHGAPSPGLHGTDPFVRPWAGEYVVNDGALGMMADPGVSARLRAEAVSYPHNIIHLPGKPHRHSCKSGKARGDPKSVVLERVKFPRLGKCSMLIVLIWRTP